MRQKLLEKMKSIEAAQKHCEKHESWAQFFTLTHEGVYVFDDEQAYFLHPATVRAKNDAS